MSQVIRRSSISDFTRGGQTTLHFLRMVGQVLRKFALFLLACIVVYILVHSFSNTTAYERYASLQWAIAKISTESLGSGDSKVRFELEDGRVVTVPKKAIAQDKGVIARVDHTARVILRGTVYSILLVGGAFFFLVIFIYRTGFALRQEAPVRGGELLDGEKQTKTLKSEGRASDIKIGNVTLPKGAEVKHLLFTGSHGSGKSVGIKEVLSTVRKRGQRAIVYSTSTEFIEAFYREGKDTILNPLDARCPSWDVWCEATKPSDFDNIAASLIPEPSAGQDPFWGLAARTMFSTVAMRMSQRGEISTPKLLRDLLTIDLDEAAKLVEGTEGGALIAEGAEKTALSVRATLSTYIRPLKFLKHTGERFSIREWVLREEGDEWIFINANAEQLETLRPLITTWLDIAATSVLSLPENPDRRIWLSVDELPSLNKLPMLENYLAQSRKYGGCSILGFQSIAQLRGRYGKDLSDAILGLCGAWMIYRANEPTMAEVASKKIGQVEVMEPSEGLSYGANEIRDGVTLSMQRKLRPLVLPTEIMNLPDLQGFACLGSGATSSTFQLKYKKFKKIAEGYIEGEDVYTSWDFSLQAEQADSEKKNSLASTADTGEDVDSSESVKQSDNPADETKNNDQPAPHVTEDMFRKVD